jgi:hypothetical protein
MTTAMYKRARVRSFAKCTVPVSVPPGWSDEFLCGRLVKKSRREVSAAVVTRIHDFEGYRRNYVLNERSVLKGCREKFDRLAVDFVRKNEDCYKKFLLKRCFWAWAGKGFVDVDSYASWQSDYRRVLMLAGREYVRQVRVYRESMSKLVEKIVVEKRYNLLKKFFVWWKEVGVEVEDRKAIPEGNPMDRSIVVTREGVRKSTGEKVKVKTRVYPMRLMYESYHSKCVLMPIDEKVKLYHQLGYPKWYLEKMILSRERRLSRKGEMEEMIERVFGKYMSKGKGSTPKPKTLQQRFK